MLKRGYPRHLFNVIASLYHTTKVVIDTGKFLKSEILINQVVRWGVIDYPHCLVFILIMSFESERGKFYRGFRLMFTNGLVIFYLLVIRL